MQDLWNWTDILSLFRGNNSLQHNVSLECSQSQVHLRDYYGPLIYVSLIYTFINAFQTRRRSCCRRHSSSNHKPVRTGDDAVGEGRSDSDREQNRCLQCVRYFHSHPGLPIPMNSLFYRHSTLAYAAGYLCAFNIIAGIFTEHYGLQRGIPGAPAWLSLLFKISVISLLSCTLLPVFISITHGGFFCWVFGALYSMFQSALLLTSFVRAQCVGYRYILRQATLQFPTLLGFVYLTFYFCHQLVSHRKLLKRNWMRYKLNKPEAYVANTASYVKSRLSSKFAGQTTNDLKRRCCLSCWQMCSRLFRPPLGFTYPPILIWSLTVSVLLQYFLVNQSLTWFHLIAEEGRYSIEQRYPSLKKSTLENLAIKNARHVFSVFNLSANTSSEQLMQRQYEFVYYWIDILWVCIVMATILALSSNIINVFRIMLHYQDLCFSIYRNGIDSVPAMKSLLNPFKVTHGTILYPSYQIALMACGFYLQLLIYGFIFCFLAVIVTMNAFTNKAFIVYFFQTSWPSMVLMTIFATVQQVAIRFLFTKHGGKSYGFNNSRSLQMYAFFASFYNVIFGLISGVARILYCPISSAISISRLDISPLSPPLLGWDTCYMAFLGFLYSDTMVNNPIKRLFLWSLLRERISDLRKTGNFDSALLNEAECFDDWLIEPDSRSKRPALSPNLEQNIHLRGIVSPISDNDVGYREAYQRCNSPVFIRARTRWFVAYTLLRNPVLKQWRKGKPKQAIGMLPPEEITDLVALKK